MIERVKNTGKKRSAINGGSNPEKRERSLAITTNFFWHVLPAKSNPDAVRFTATFYLGVLSFLLFLILIITGVLIAFYYHPSVPQAYYDMKELTFVVSSGWFLRNFRNLLVMEDGQSLWVARGTPRVWLGQGKQISVQNAPTYFGTLAYEIISDADNGKITATVEIPTRNSPKSVIVRLRHPKAAPIKSVTVNNQPWTEFNPDKEIIELKDLTGKAVVVASY